MIEKSLIEQFYEFQNLKKNDKIQIVNGYFHQLFHNLDFYLLLQNQDFHDFYKTGISMSKLVVIDEYKDLSSRTIYSTDFLIICFDNKVIIINQSQISQLFWLFVKNIESKIYFLTEKCRSILEKNNSALFLNFAQNIDSNLMDKEIPNLMNEFSIRNKKVALFWKSIQRCISSYLILKSYISCEINRIKTIQLCPSKTIEKVSKYNEIVRLKIIFLSSSQIFLAYIIENERLCIAKMLSDSKLFDREKMNYSMLNHPLIPKYYGYVNEINGEKSLLIEYIEGKTLNEINQLNLSIQEKISIIFEIMIVIQYLHFNGFIYRDLKPNNVIIDKNKTAVLIDFDRLIKCDGNNSCENSTRDFCHSYIAPEILSGKSYSYSADIYSLGLLIYFIIMEEEPSLNINLKLPIFFSEYQSNFELCICENPLKRPTISKLIWKFFIEYINDMYLIELLEYNVSNGNESLIDGLNYGYLGSFFYKLNNINKSIHYFQLGVKKGFISCMLNLGKIYFSGEHVEKDIQKSIYYFTLASNLNDMESQFILGYIYEEYLFDIQKAKYYYELSANQNYCLSQINLGKLYSSGMLGYVDYKKAFYYFTLAANQGSDLAQFDLAQIYLNFQGPFYDINKAIYYLTLSANQNFPNAQHVLAQIYLSGYSKDLYNISKGLYYETLAAEQNFADAQYNLGIIYINGVYTTQNISKGIDYLKLAEKQGHQEAKTELGLFFLEAHYDKRDINKTLYYCKDISNPANAIILGYIYLYGIDVPRDVDKAIYYFETAAKKNDKVAQYCLGIIYLNRIGDKIDLKKGFHYMSLSAEQNYPKALFEIGRVYYYGNDYIKQNRKKAIFYYALASDKNNSNAQFNLGSIYMNGIDTPQNINKSIYYYNLSASQNNPHAQYALGLIYSNGCVPRNISKAINYYLLASEQNIILAQVNLALIYHEGKYIKRNIQKAIHFYKKASCFNNNVAKNNLGVIYRFGIEIKSNVYMAMEYFKEAIKQKNDDLAKFNLSHIYLYEKIDKKLDDAMNLLLSILKHDMDVFTILFSLVIFQKYEQSINKINHELSKINNESLNNVMIKKIMNIISQFNNPDNYKECYNKIENVNYIYFKTNGGYLSELFSANIKSGTKTINLKKNLNSNFYTGLDIDLITST